MRTNRQGGQHKSHERQHEGVPPARQVGVGVPLERQHRQSERIARREQHGILQHPITETAVAYLIALVASAAMLVFFGNVQPGDPWALVLTHVVLLGLPAAIGGAAGRLAI